MKRLIFIAGFILVFLGVLLYAAIPSVITVKNVMSVKCIDKNILTLLTDKTGWLKWLPQDTASTKNIQYKGYQIRIEQTTFSSVEFDATKNDLVIRNQINFVKDSVTKTNISLFSSVRAGMNPIKRFINWRTMKNYEHTMNELLQQFTLFAEDRKNIYGVNIIDGRIPDSLFISSRQTFDHEPTVAELYQLIDELSAYAAAKGARQINPPMLHLEYLNSNACEVMVALPVDRVIDNSGNFLFKQMVKGNTLLAEVKGGRATINAALRAMEQFKSDYQFSSPAISFELMITDRRIETDTSKWVTKLYYPIF